MNGCYETFLDVMAAINGITMRYSDFLSSGQPRQEGEGAKIGCSILKTSNKKGRIAIKFQGNLNFFMVALYTKHLYVT